MVRVISIAARKGGVGKSTTAMNLAYGIGETGMKVLLIDTDGQANLTNWILEEIESSLAEVIDGQISMQDAIHKTDLKFVDIIPGHTRIHELEDKIDAYFLKENIDKVKNLYDFVIIDTPPSLGVITVGAMVAADEIISPVKAEYGSLQSIPDVINAWKTIKDGPNPDLKLIGIVLTMFESSTNLAKSVEETVKQIPDVFIQKIRRTIKIAEAPSQRKPIQFYSPFSTGGLDYDELVDRVLTKNKKK